MNPILLYIIIFAAKIVEVTIGVFRMVLITKGEENWQRLLPFLKL